MYTRHLFPPKVSKSKLTIHWVVCEYEVLWLNSNKIGGWLDCRCICIYTYFALYYVRHITTIILREIIFPRFFSILFLLHFIQFYLHISTLICSRILAFFQTILHCKQSWQHCFKTQSRINCQDKIRSSSELMFELRYKCIAPLTVNFVYSERIGRPLWGDYWHCFCKSLLVLREISSIACV